MSLTELQLAIEKAVAEDWDLIKDTTGKACDARAIFDLAYRFGWHASDKYHQRYKSDGED